MLLHSLQNCSVANYSLTSKSGSSLLLAVVSERCIEEISSLGMQVWFCYDNDSLEVWLFELSLFLFSSSELELCGFSSFLMNLFA